ncbi:lysergyl peptide synthetase subunit 1 [Penicillium canescens]|nr:lysergyl peptide synthetase subunit 1 [Penicillium canescens]KAJ6158394.1 lysergyl peptide synthetase subunit 1 [Penicillium canescens]
MFLVTLLERPQLFLREIDVLGEEQRNICLAYLNNAAVCAWDGESSYSLLDQLSSSLAKELISHGIGVEATIPVLSRAATVCRDHPIG